MENILNQSKMYVQSAIEIMGQWVALAKKSFRFPKYIEPLIRKMTRSAWFPLVGLIPFLAAAPALYRSLPAIAEVAPGLAPPSRSTISVTADSVMVAGRLKLEEKEITRLQDDLDRLTPRSGYMVINTTNNVFILYSGSKRVREGVCSTGSYTLLTDGKEKKWYFQTPKGVFRIRQKIRNPVWKKPDWAFVEEGLPVPSPNHSSRIEYGTLGDYALSLGDGYLIHGTLYQRFLGLPVTHGCVRLGDDDLEAVYKTLKVGAKVYIY